MKLYELANLVLDQKTKFFIYNNNEWDNLRIINWQTDIKSTDWRNKVLQEYGQFEVGSIQIVDVNALGVYLK